MNLNSLAAAETASETCKTSWGAWLLSSLYKKAGESKEDKLRKDRERLERRNERDIKQCRLEWKRIDLKKEENLLCMT